MHSKLLRLIFSTLLCLAGLSALARDDIPLVSYAPGLTIVEGDQPLTSNFVLSITSPFNVAAGSNLSITPVVTVVTKPAGVADATALSYVSLSPATLVFTGPSQTLTTMVSCSFPLGVVAGSYAYQLSTPGWASGTQDPGAFINATVFPQRVGDVPSVTITRPTDNEAFVYQPVVGPLTVPLQFTASAPSVTPITAIDADINGVPVTLTTTTNADGSLSASGSTTITRAGTYSAHARATNSLGTSSDAADFSVTVSAPPPVVTISQPTATSYSFASGTTLNIAFSCSATSYYGGISSLSATLNGQPVTLTASGLGQLTATGTGTLAITAGGSYVFTVTATDPNGSGSASKSFTVTATAPAPTVTITAPANGAVYTRVAGSSATIIPFAYNATAGTSYTISSLTGSLNGTPLSATVSGLNTQTATSNGSLSITTAGTYTLTASAKSGTAVGATSITFTVKETQPPPPPCTITWLPPISLGKVQQGGSVLPIKFTLECGCNDVDRSVIIVIYEIYSNGSTSTPVVYPYDRGSPNPPTYTINGNGMYHLNFPTAKGTHRYHIDVYRTSPAAVLFGSKEFTTK